MSKLKKLAKDFKEFISRGNVVDMAVAVIIGAAFSAIVTALTNQILRPLIDWAVGGEGAVGLKTMLKTVYEVGESGAVLYDEAGNAIINWTNSIYIDWGTFIMAIVDFILIAIVLFVIVKVFMGLQNAGKEISSKENRENYKQAKKLAKEKGITVKEALAQMEEEKAAVAAAEAEEAAKNAPAPVPTTEELLIQIRDLLAAQNGAPVNKE